MADHSDEVPISHLQRRKIEGRVLIPFIAACQEKFGDAATRELVLAAIRQLAIEDNRDHAMIDGFNPAIKLTRTQTVMEGATHCDFRFTAKDPPG